MIPLIPEDIEQPAGLVAAIRSRRKGKLLKLDRMLLHSPPLAEGWNIYLRKVREDLQVPIRLRELAMCVVAVLNDASYEYEHHAPLYVTAGGSEEQAQALRNVAEPSFNKLMFPELDQAVIELAREMTLRVKVRDSLKEQLLALVGTRQTVELVGVVATYNMVSRFLVALDITNEEPKP